jgi:hypothetical protein
MLLRRTRADPNWGLVNRAVGHADMLEMKMRVTPAADEAPAREGSVMISCPHVASPHVEVQP